MCVCVCLFVHHEDQKSKAGVQCAFRYPGESRGHPSLPSGVTVRGYISWIPFTSRSHAGCWATSWELRLCAPMTPPPRGRPGRWLLSAPPVGVTVDRPTRRSALRDQPTAESPGGAHAAAAEPHRASESPRRATAGAIPAPARHLRRRDTCATCARATAGETSALSCRRCRWHRAVAEEPPRRREGRRCLCRRAAAKDEEGYDGAAAAAVAVGKRLMKTASPRRSPQKGGATETESAVAAPQRRRMDAAAVAPMPPREGGGRCRLLLALQLRERRNQCELRCRTCQALRWRVRRRDYCRRRRSGGLRVISVTHTRQRAAAPRI